MSTEVVLLQLQNIYKNYVMWKNLLFRQHQKEKNRKQTDADAFFSKVLYMLNKNVVFILL
jgi:hypothetical protein